MRRKKTLDEKRNGSVGVSNPRLDDLSGAWCACEKDSDWMEFFKFKGEKIESDADVMMARLEDGELSEPVELGEFCQLLLREILRMQYLAADDWERDELRYRFEDSRLVFGAEDEEAEHAVILSVLDRALTVGRKA